MEAIDIILLIFLALVSVGGICGYIYFIKDDEQKKKKDF